MAECRMNDQAETADADYVVVGAGSAGCVVAARLSEDASASVVVLEAGVADRNVWIHVPIGYGKTIVDPRLNWRYETEPDPAIAGRRMYWARGKVLGGSSSINGLLYIRGQPEDYDHWRQLGAAGWSYADVLPYFKRAERQENGADDFHGADGPLAVSNLIERNPLCEAFIESAVATGVPRNEDFNGAVQEGVGFYQLTTRNARRCSAAVAYLHPAMKRPNLRVFTEAFVEKILFKDRRASGVQFSRGGRTMVVRCRREVILCGGSLNSPQLLMLSGVGPNAHLAEHGIAVVNDLPGVGQNLQDHYGALITYKSRLPVTVNDIMVNPLRQLKAGLQYLLFRKGPLTISAAQVGAFIRSRPEVSTPDIQFLFQTFSHDEYDGGLHKFSGFANAVCPLRPQSRGALGLKSPDPREPPAMRPNYLGRNRQDDTRRCDKDRPQSRRTRSDRSPHSCRICPRTAGHHRRRDPWLCARDRPLHCTSGRHLQNGQRPHGRGCSGPHRAWGRRAAGRRCLDHADVDFRKHQCRHHHDRRKGVRYDPAVAAARYRCMTGSAVQHRETTGLLGMDRKARQMGSRGSAANNCNSGRERREEKL
jgi:choline dehydrogenase